jgi:hypothetical protein
VKPSRIVLLAGLVLALVPLAGSLWASAGGDGTTIHACVGRFGRIWIVPDASYCRWRQKHLEWNSKGPQGEPGPPGIAGELATYTRSSSEQEVEPDLRGEAYAECDAGDLVTGGGYVFLIESPGCAVVEENFPEDLDSWLVTVKNECDEEVYVTAWAVCAHVTPPD